VPAAACHPDGEVGDGAHTHPVRARPVQDAGTVEAVTGAYAAKYGDSPYVGQNQDEQAQADPSEAPGFGDRISHRRRGAELGHQLSRAP
jgi:hypothetical protein